MELYDIPGFVDYIGAKPARNEDVYIAKFVENPDTLLKSAPIKLDFYVFSLEYDVKSNLTKGSTEDGNYSNYIYYDKPGCTLEWDLKELCKGYFVLLSFQSFNRFVEKDSFLNFHGQRVYLNSREKNTLINILEAAYNAYENESESNELVISYSFLVLSHIHQYYRKYLIDRPKTRQDIVGKFFDLLIQDYSESNIVNVLPRVSEISNRLNLSSKYFGELIKSSTGLSPKAHINRRVIEVSKRKLKSSDASIAYISTQLGFEFQTYFTRFFKKSTGLTPSEFRNRNLFQ
ncbi:helix-turn-helix domain-containing protein [Roseivirga pacifica]|uniref:helix-turn-helix domain-containing protein n=1 Tax=Roseivirga pacifica TaxID=1267423 RepID=UPI00227CAE86|nr:helix-turn-helix domain-containing protein [Roseivirga pacifica]